MSWLRAQENDHAAAYCHGHAERKSCTGMMVNLRWSDLGFGRFGGLSMLRQRQGVWCLLLLHL